MRSPARSGGRCILRVSRSAGGFTRRDGGSSWPGSWCSARGCAGSPPAMLLGRDGHDVTVLERDPARVPESPHEAWERWDAGRRRAVPPAALLSAPRPSRPGRRAAGRARRPRGAAGAAPLRHPRPRPALPRLDLERRADDERFVTLTARRPTIEQVVARAAEAEPRLEVRRGVAVASLTDARSSGIPHVIGVRTESGEELARRSGRRCDGPAVAAAAVARARREPPRSPRRPRTPASSTTRATSGRRAAAARTARPAARPRRVGFDPHPARRQRHVVGHPVRLLGRPPAEAASRSRPVDGRRGRMPAARALARRRADHQRPADGRRARSVPSPRRRWPPGGDRPGRRRATPGPARTRRSGAASPSDWSMPCAFGTSPGPSVEDPETFAAAWDATTEAELTPWYRGDRRRRSSAAGGDRGAPRGTTNACVRMIPAAALAAALGRAMPHDADIFRAFMEIVGCLTLPARGVRAAGLRRPGPGRRQPPRGCASARARRGTSCCD